MTHPLSMNTELPNTSTGGRLVSVDGRALPLTQASLQADAIAGVVRVTLEQTFRNPHDEPLTVTYSLPLPADGAVSGFSFLVGGELVVGEVDTKQKARTRFDEAVLSGRTAALLDQERSSLFTQQVGNVPPRTEVVCRVQVDQKLAWLPDGCWEWRFPTVVAPRYLGAEGRVADGAKVSVDVADRELPVKLGLTLSVRDRLVEGSRPESVTHPLHTERLVGRTEVRFGDERGAALDRDVVVRWKVAGLTPGVAVDTYEKDGRTFALVTLVPPMVEAKMAAVPRDLIVLLDTSGSMGGGPIDQARRVTAALVDSLTDQDQLELIEFSSTARRWKRGSVSATAANRRDAQAWLARLQASGGTEMRTGILEALAPLRKDAQRQVVLITDGLIGFESEVVQAIAHQLPRGSRVHTIGVGSGVNRSLTQPAARAGRGLELILGLGEDVEVTVKRLLARTTAPLVTNLEVTGASLVTQAPARLPDLYAGAPAMLSLEVRGTEPLVIIGETANGPLHETVSLRSVSQGSPAVATLFARELVEDLELSLASGAQKSEVDRSIEALGLTFQISTRLTSWVAVSAKPTVDPRAPRRSETMPQNLAYGLSAEGVGLRSATAASPVMASPMAGGNLGLAEMSRSRGAPSGARPAMRKAAAAPPPPAMEDVDEAAEEFDEGEGEREPEFERSMVRSERAPAPRPTGAPARASAGAPPPPPAPAAAPAPGAGPSTSDEKKTEEVADAPLRRVSLLDLAKDLLGRALGTEDAKADAPAQAVPPAKAKVAGAKPVAPRVLSAKIVLRADGTTTLEILVEGAPLDWAPASVAKVELADGRVVEVAVVLSRTTVNGQHGVGLALSLVLQTEALPIRRVHLESHGQPLQIEVR
jgi:Ca-activated chloride channel family protein